MLYLPTTSGETLAGLEAKSELPDDPFTSDDRQPLLLSQTSHAPAIPDSPESLPVQEDPTTRHLCLQTRDPRVDPPYSSTRQQVREYC